MSTRFKIIPNSTAEINGAYNTSLEISAERDKTEREIKRLAESGFKDEAWKLLVKHLQIKEPRGLKVSK